MLKVALLAATILVAASQALAANVDVPATAASAAEAAIPATELAGTATSAPGLDWTPLHPAHAAGLGFKDAATEPATVLPAGADSDHSHTLVSALVALGGLLVLLRKRPT